MKSFLKKIKVFFLPCKENNYRPVVLGNKFLISYLVILILLKVFFVSFLVCFPKTDFFADISKALLFDLTNEDREELALNSLKRNKLLDEAARLKAEDMIENDYFSHMSPSGVTPWYWIDKVGYDYNAAGENLGIGFIDSEEIYQAWYDSVLHQKNLLNAKYDEMGIAILRGDFQGRETTVVVQLFGSQKEKSFVFLEETEEVVLEPEKEETEKEESKEEEEKVVLSEQEDLTEEFSFQEKNQGVVSGISNFIVKDYNRLVQKIIFYSLCLITFLLVINLIVKFDIEHRDLVFKAAGFSVVLIVFSLFNKEFILDAIPHALLLNFF